MIIGHKIEKKVSVNKLLKEIKKYSVDDIIATNHAFFRLSEKQKKYYQESEIKNILFNYKPFFSRNSI